MIDYATWCAIRDGVAQHLTPRQLADHLGVCRIGSNTVQSTLAQRIFIMPQQGVES
jgi:hypothetical protein